MLPLPPWPNPISHDEMNSDATLLKSQSFAQASGKLLSELAPGTEDGSALALKLRRDIACREVDSLTLVADYLKDAAQRGLASATLHQYTQVFRGFFLVVGSIPLNELKPRDIREFLAWQKWRGASDGTLRRILCALRSVFRFAELIEAVSVSPARAVQTRHVRRRFIPTGTNDENES